MNYYNEFDPHAAAWLRELINQKLIPAGDVDTRSIADVIPSDLHGYTQCHFFAGIGGWSLALQISGWPDDRPVWTGSCPCQPFSVAGEGKGTADERHLWPVFFDLIRECRPERVFGEQVANAIGKGWLDGISTDLESEDYACGAAVLGAHSVGAPHLRQRLYWGCVAYAEWHEQSRKKSRIRKTGRVGRVVEPFPWDEHWESALRRFRALGDGLPRSVAFTDGARNAIVPQVGAEFVKAFLESIGDI